MSEDWSKLGITSLPRKFLMKTYRMPGLHLLLFQNYLGKTKKGKTILKP